MKEERFKLVGQMLGEIIEVKDKKYGSSFEKSTDFIKLAYPNGVPVDQYKNMLTITRIFDKIMRVATNKDPEGETPFADIGGYALLAVISSDYAWERLIAEHTKIMNEKDETRGKRRKIGGESPQGIIGVGGGTSTAYISEEMVEKLQVQIEEETGIRGLAIRDLVIVHGPVDTPIRINSWKEYKQNFGTEDASSKLGEIEKELEKREKEYFELNERGQIRSIIEEEVAKERALAAKVHNGKPCEDTSNTLDKIKKAEDEIKKAEEENAKKLYSEYKERK